MPLHAIAFDSLPFPSLPFPSLPFPSVRIASQLFLASWRFLDEEEQLFAAAFYLQCWWRRLYYADDPDELAKHHGATSLLEARARVRYTPAEREDDACVLSVCACVVCGRGSLLRVIVRRR